MTERISQSSPQVDSAQTTGHRRATAGVSSLCSACRTSTRPDTVTGDRVLRASAAIVVLAVAAFAAVVSYSHIYDLGRAHGQAGVAARLLPLSVDGLILAASLVMLLEARAGRTAPVLARVMLGLGVAATVAANVAFGAADGLTGAAISAWPAIAFIGSAELLIGSIRRTRPLPKSGSVAGQSVPAVFGEVPSEQPCQTSFGYRPRACSRTISPPGGPRRSERSDPACMSDSLAPSRYAATWHRSAGVRALSGRLQVQVGGPESPMPYGCLNPGSE